MDKWETIIDWTAEETMLSKTFTTDDNGEPFELKKVSIFVAVAPPEDSSITTNMNFNVSLTSQTSTFAALLGGAPKYGEKKSLRTCFIYAYTLWVIPDYTNLFSKQY